MKNVVSKKMQNDFHALRFVVLLFALFAYSVVAEAGKTFSYKYTVNVKPQSENPGKGVVYLNATAKSYQENGTTVITSYDSDVAGLSAKVDPLYNKEEPLTVKVEYTNADYSGYKLPNTEYTSVQLVAEEKGGSKFEKWTWDGGSSTETTISVRPPKKMKMQGMVILTVIWIQPVALSTLLIFLFEPIKLAWKMVAP